MPANASIRLDGIATPNEGYDIGETVSLANFDDTDVLTWMWILEAKPNGSAAALLTSISGSTNSFVADLEGAYRVSLSVNGGTKDKAVARIKTLHKGLQPLAKNETSEGDVTDGEGWAKPWRESYLLLDKALGLADRRTVVLTSGVELGSGPFVFQTVGEFTLPNGDVVPAVSIAVPTADAFRGKGLYLYDYETTPNTNVPLNVLARGLSNPLDNDPSVSQGGTGFVNDSFQNAILGANNGKLIHENDYVNQPPVDRRFYLGHCVNEITESAPFRFWFNPATAAPDTMHGFLSNPPQQTNALPGQTVQFHQTVAYNDPGFMSPSQKAGLDEEMTHNLIDNANFDFWQRGSGSLDSGHFPLSESLAVYQQFMGAPSRSYTADRWYATAMHYNAANLGPVEVSGTWSRARSDTMSAQNHPYCMRVTNKSQNVAPSGSGIFDFGVGHFLVQEFSQETINKLKANFVYQENPQTSVRLRLRAGAGINDYVQILAGIVATNQPDPGTLPNYFFSAPYTTWQYLASGQGIRSTDWQAFIFNSNTTIGEDVTAAAFVVFSLHPSGSVIYKGNGTPDDYWEIDEVCLTSGSNSDLPRRFSYKGGSKEADLAECRRWYSKSYPLDVAPGLPTNQGVKRGIVTYDGLIATPDVRFHETLASGSALQLSIVDPVSGSSDSVFVAGVGIVGSTPLDASSEGFSVQMNSPQTFGREVRFHYTASVDI